MSKRTRKLTHPGAILKELYLDELHIGISEFADRIGISRKTVSGIVNGHRGVTPEMWFIAEVLRPLRSRRITYWVKNRFGSNIGNGIKE